MKSVEQINKMIISECDYLERNHDTIKSKDIKKVNKKIEFLKYVVMYLESRPRKEFVESEIDRIKTQIASTDTKFDYWTIHSAPLDVDPKKYRSIFNKEVGITKLKNQLKTLEFINE